MKRWVWMNAWDLEGKDPAALIAELRETGLNGCSLGLSYHGGRMLLGRHASRLVFEQPAGALYFRAETSRFPRQLRPSVAGQAGLAEAFLEECVRSGFGAQAWLVLCHNDALGVNAPECCVENAFGEKYPYALCPANEQVQEYVVELCRQAAAVPGAGVLDLEALSWLGYEHQGLHEKCGVPVSKEAAWWLSICCCASCRAGTGDLREAIRGQVRAWLDQPWKAGAAGFDEAADWRRQVQMRLLRRIREAVPAARLNLRLNPVRKWSGGKCTLGWDDIDGLAEEATVTFFGASETAMADALAALPGDRRTRLNGGVVFHGPDCAAEQDVLRRAGLLNSARLDGHGFYSYGMAARAHWTWLRRALQEGTQ